MKKSCFKMIMHNIKNLKPIREMYTNLGEDIANDLFGIKTIDKKFLKSKRKEKVIIVSKEKQGYLISQSTCKIREGRVK